MSSEFDAIVIGAGPAGEVCAGELVSEARQAPGAKQAIAAPIDVAQALAWRDFMISDWDDADKVDWLEKQGIELLRAEVPLEILRDTIQPLPSFSEVLTRALDDLG